MLHGFVPPNIPIWQYGTFESVLVIRGLKLIKGILPKCRFNLMPPFSNGHVLISISTKPDKKIAFQINTENRYGNQQDNNFS